MMILHSICERNLICSGYNWKFSHRTVLWMPEIWFVWWIILIWEQLVKVFFIKFFEALLSPLFCLWTYLEQMKIFFFLHFGDLGNWERISRRMAHQIDLSRGELLIRVNCSLNCVRRLPITWLANFFSCRNRMFKQVATKFLQLTLASKQKLTSVYLPSRKQMAD